MREDERVRDQQGRHVQEGDWHCLQPEHPVHVEEGIHSRVLARPQVDELLLSADQTDETRTRTKDVRQGTVQQHLKQLLSLRIFHGVTTAYTDLQCREDRERGRPNECIKMVTVSRGKKL